MGLTDGLDILTNSLAGVRRGSRNRPMWGSVSSISGNDVFVVLDEDISGTPQQVAAKGVIVAPGQRVAVIYSDQKLIIIGNSTGSLTKQVIGPVGDNSPMQELARDRPWGKAGSYTYLAANGTTAEWAVAIRDNDTTTGTLRLDKDRALTYQAAGGSPKKFAFEPDDTGWVTSGILSATAGVSIGSYRFRKVGPWVTCDVVLTATVAYTLGTSGDISNSTYSANITDSRFWPTGGSQALSPHGSTGRLISAAVETTGGRILIGAFGGTSNIAVGDVFRMGGVYFAG